MTEPEDRRRGTRVEDRLTEIAVQIAKLEMVRDEIRELKQSFEDTEKRLDKDLKLCQSKIEEALVPIKWAKTSIKVLTGLAVVTAAAGSLFTYFSTN